VGIVATMSWLKRLLGGKAPALPQPATTPSDRAPTLELDEVELEQTITALFEPLERTYAQQKSFYYGVNIDYEDGGPDPLNGIHVYWNPDGPHWHYVSSGLFRFGCPLELTLRLQAQPDELGADPQTHLAAIAYRAPTWPIPVLNMLARRVLRTRRPFGNGHWWQGPPGNRPEFLIFADDPDLGTVTTPRGPVAYIQAMAVRAETIEAFKRDEQEQRGNVALDSLRQTNPRLVTARELVA
jgi:hypothetical protein